MNPHHQLNRAEEVTTATPFFTIDINNTTKILQLLQNTSSSSSFNLDHHHQTSFFSTPFPVYSFGAASLPLLLLTILLILLLFGWLYSVFTAAKRAFTPEPEDQQQLCPHPEMDPRVLEYRIIFRLGCASPLFNLAKGWVEFLLIEEEDGAPLFQPVRFKTADLRRDALCAELVLILYRGWALPPLIGVLARHSEPDEVIFFFEFSIYGPVDPKAGGGCMQGGQLVYLGTSPIHDWIGSTEAFYEIKQGGNSDLSTSKKGSTSASASKGSGKKGGKRGSSNKRKGSPKRIGKRGEALMPLDDFPLMPELEWEPVELVFCAVVSVAVLAAVLMAIEYFNFYPGFDDWNGDGPPMIHQRGSFYRSLLDAAFSLPVSLTLLVVILVGYKYCIKK